MDPMDIVVVDVEAAVVVVVQVLLTELEQGLA